MSEPTMRDIGDLLELIKIEREARQSMLKVLEGAAETLRLQHLQIINLNERINLLQARSEVASIGRRWSWL